MSTTAMWTSKLGSKYPMAWMQQNDASAQRELKRLRSLHGNTTCADCGRQDNSWASVSHGVFICVTCSDVHRSVGTHITKVKGCTGTYLWGPDELEKMTSVGNVGAITIYGEKKIDPSATKEAKQRYVEQKYQQLAFAAGSASHMASGPSTLSRTAVVDALVSKAAAVPSSGPASRLKNTASHSSQASAKACLVSDTWFDEFFNEAEDSNVGKFNVVKPCSSTATEHSNDLDSFLNSTLSANHKSNLVTFSENSTRILTAFPASGEPMTAEDPFADWFDF